MTILTYGQAAGLIYARLAQNDGLCAELHSLGARELPDSLVQALAKAISPSPAQVDGAVAESYQAIPPAGIVELVSFIALMQMMHRLSSFLEPS